MSARAWGAGGLIASALVLLQVTDPLGGPDVCHLVDTSPGVEVVRDAAPGDGLPEGSAPAQVEVCVDGRCASVHLQSERSFAPLRLPDDRGVDLGVTVTAGDGTTSTSTLIGRTTPQSPNGEGCGPTVGRLAVALDPEGRPRLVPPTPPAGVPS